MRVAIFVDNFSATGVVINAIAIAKHLHDRDCTVQLIATQAEGALIGTIPADVSIVGLLPGDEGKVSRSLRLRRSLWAFRRSLKAFAPDVLFSAGNHGHLASVLASRALPGCRTIVRISNDIDHMIDGKPSKPFMRWRRIVKFRVVAALADKLVFVSRHLVRSKAVRNSAAILKAVVIPNGVDATAIRRRAEEACSHPWLAEAAEAPLVLAVGRLALQKNFATLLRAVAIARKARPLRLLIIGSGPLKRDLLALADELGIADAVEIMKPIANPMPFLSRSSVVALPSWWEGPSTPNQRTVEKNAKFTVVMIQRTVRRHPPRERRSIRSTEMSAPWRSATTVHSITIQISRRRKKKEALAERGGVNQATPRARLRRPNGVVPPGG